MAVDAAVPVFSSRDIPKGKEHADDAIDEPEEDEGAALVDPPDGTCVAAVDADDDGDADDAPPLTMIGSHGGLIVLVATTTDNPEPQMKAVKASLDTGFMVDTEFIESTTS